MTRSALAPRRSPACALVAASAALIATAAAATATASGIESPGTGVSQVGRGSAWVARADDPLAAYMNPAALATQASGAHVGAHLMLMNQCFTRRGPGNTPVPPAPGFPAPGEPGGPDAEVCSEGGVFPNPQLAGALRLGDRIAIGLALLGPHAVGNQQWPETVTEPSGQVQPAPQRYLLVSSESLIVLPTLSVGFAITPEISVGAGFIWGVASVDVVNFSEATSSTGGDNFDAHQDLRSRFQATDLFVPGFVLGGLFSPMSRLDVGAWFKWQDAIRSRTHLTIESLYWAPAGRPNEDPCATREPGCNLTDDEDAGTFKLAIPMEARLGLRYHHPRAAGDARDGRDRRDRRDRRDQRDRPTWAAGARRVRDPMSEDLFDIELDFTWAHNSALDAVEIRFDENIPVRGTDVGFVPPVADVPHEWRDVLGVHLGGDVVALPNLLAFRAGGFFETQGQEDAYLNLDFHLGWRAGLAAGATVRLGPVDVSVAYQHTFFGALDNGGEGSVKALSGDASTNYQSVQSVNGGRLESSLDELALGATLRF